MLRACHHPIMGWVGSQGAKAEALRVGSKLVPFLLSVCSPSFQQRGAVLEGEGPEQVTSVGRGMCWGSLGRQSEPGKARNPLPPRAPVMAALTPFRLIAGSQPALFPLTLHPPWQQQPSPQWGAAPEEEGLEQVLSMGQSMWCGGCGKLAKAQTVSTCFSCLGPRSKQVCVLALHERSLDFLQTSCQSHWFSQHLRGLVLAVLNRRVRCPTCGSNHSLSREDLKTK